MSQPPVETIDTKERGMINTPDLNTLLGESA